MSEQLKRVPVTPKLTDRQLNKLTKDARDEGYADGVNKGRLEIIDFLEHAYLKDEGRPDRGTPEANAILTLAREAHAHFMKKLTGPHKKKGRS